MPQLMTDWHAMERRARANLDKAAARLGAAQKAVELAAIELGQVRVAMGLVVCRCCKKLYDGKEFCECPFCFPTEHSSNMLEAGHNRRAEAVRR